MASQQLEMLDRIDARATLHGLVSELLAQSGLPHPIDDDAALADAGLTSADMVSLLLAIQTAFDVEIAQDDITPEAFRSVNSLSALIANYRAAGEPG